MCEDIDMDMDKHLTSTRPPHSPPTHGNKNRNKNILHCFRGLLQMVPEGRGPREESLACRHYPPTSTQEYDSPVPNSASVKTTRDNNQKACPKGWSNWCRKTHRIQIDYATRRKTKHTHTANIASRSRSAIIL